jgi:hypothetical protein
MSFFGSLFLCLLTQNDIESPGRDIPSNMSKDTASLSEELPAALFPAFVLVIPVGAHDVVGAEEVLGATDPFPVFARLNAFAPRMDMLVPFPALELPMDMLALFPALVGAQEMLGASVLFPALVGAQEMLGASVLFPALEEPGDPPFMIPSIERERSLGRESSS